MTILVGSRVTWFLGSGNGYIWRDPTGHLWVDTGARRNREGAFASGLPYSTAGVALTNHDHTLGGWWRINLARQNIEMVVPQVDIAPPATLDLSAHLAYEVYTKPDSVGDTPWTAEFIGHKLPQGIVGGITNTRTKVMVPLEGG